MHLHDQDTPAFGLLEKLCSKCGESWPADEEFFYRDKRKHDGLSRACKACFAEMPSARRRGRYLVGPVRSDWEQLFSAP